MTTMITTPETPEQMGVLQAAIMEGKAAVVPMAWLTRMLSETQREHHVTRAVKRRIKRERPKATSTEPRKRGRIPGVYAVTQPIRQTVRGRETMQHVYECLKLHPEGLTLKQLADQLQAPTSTMHYTLTQLQDRRAVAYSVPT